MKKIFIWRWHTRNRRFSAETSNREFEKLRWVLRRNSHIKIELRIRLSVKCDYSMLVKLYKIGEVALWLAWHKWFSCRGKELKIYGCRLALSSAPQKWKFHVVVWQTTSNNYTKKACRLCSTIIFTHLIDTIAWVRKNNQSMWHCHFLNSLSSVYDIIRSG